MWAFFACTLTQVGTLTPYDDFHYPSEEAAERASAPLPTCTSSSGATAVLRDSISGATTAAVEGGIAWGWHVLLVDGYVVVERNFARWGVIAMLSCSSNGGAPAPPLYVGRKAVGALDKIVQPIFNLTRDVGANYWSDVQRLHRDYAMELALANLTVDGEPTFAAAARMFAPQRDIS